MAADLEGTYLERIVSFHRSRAAADERPTSELAARAAAASSPRGFGRALAAGPGMGVIAEIKRRSPRRGELDRALDPAQLARLYEAEGARCLSVLTDEEHFSGSAEDLRAARSSVGVPVLRKDFTVSLRDVYEARALGADAVLLIAAALSDAELLAYRELAESLGMDALVEVHDEGELERALRAGSSLLGVNQRDLRTFEIDSSRALRLARAMPAEAVKVAESGVSSPAQLAPLLEAGFAGVLVGEAFILAPDRRATVSSFVRTAAGTVAPCG